MLYILYISTLYKSIIGKREAKCSSESEIVTQKQRAVAAAALDAAAHQACIDSRIYRQSALLPRNNFVSAVSCWINQPISAAVTAETAGFLSFS